MELRTKKYDVANYLDCEEMIAVYLDPAIKSGGRVAYCQSSM